MELKKYLEENKRFIEDSLLESLGDSSIPAKLFESMAYSLRAGGKRLRPILVMAGAEAVGGDVKDVMNAAMAIEMIHTFSLIHDDLPAMDDDDLRRGKPTNHKVYGEAIAVLAGDGLLIQAFDLLTRNATDPALSMKVANDFAVAAGACGMTGGQVIDMESTGKLISEEELNKLHAYKTGALLRVSVVSGAKLSGASDEEIAALESYGADIGLAFQIQDDVLDIEGDEKLLGKDVGSDEGNLKSTYPAIIGLAESKKKARELIERAISALSIFGDKAEPLRQIANYIIERDM